ncbi:MAG: hypothetical protein KGJ38_18480, partial [Burkholderiaceae bacterium]|nr:hypothetical protein [Burkholderiaceae bacterium]
MKPLDSKWVDWGATAEGDGGFWGVFFFLAPGFLFLVHPLFHPLPGLTHFLCLAKESKQRKARPRWRK